MGTLFAQIDAHSEPQGRVGKQCGEVKGALDLESENTGCVPVCHKLNGASVSSSAVQKSISMYHCVVS